MDIIRQAGAKNQSGCGVRVGRTARGFSGVAFLLDQGADGLADLFADPFGTIDGEVHGVGEDGT